jgi:hypothetical protein
MIQAKAIARVLRQYLQAWHHAAGGIGAPERRIVHQRHVVHHGNRSCFNAVVAEVVGKLIGGAVIAILNAEKVFHIDSVLRSHQRLRKAQESADSPQLSPTTR